MPRDILSEYGRDKPSHEKPRATSGGEKTARDVMNYMPPVGPKHQHHIGPGLHDQNLGSCGTQGPEAHRPSTSGSPGIGGTNRGNRGVQR